MKFLKKNTSFRIKSGIVLLGIVCFYISCNTPSGASSSSVSNAGEASAPTDDYYNGEHIRYENYSYRDNIKTIILAREGFEMSAPIIELNSGQKLVLDFDDLEGGTKDYSYTYIHCDANWQPSDISESQYLSGFNEDKIVNYSFSFNTIQKYTHYNVIFPNQNMVPMLSGNYILLVFENYDKTKIVLTQRFMILDYKVSVKSRCHRATLGSERESRQEIDFSIEHGGYPINNPMGDIKVVIRQNDNWNMIIKDLKPLFISANELDYNYDEENVFDGGKEFRQFDIRSLRLKTEFVEDIQYDSSMNHVYLRPDRVRAGKMYFFDNDINGKYVIRIREGRNNNIEADYSLVHFKLEYPEVIPDGNVYISGAMCNNTYSDESKMKYDASKSAYVKELFLKQGYYNYRYIFLKDGSKRPDLGLIEGNHSDTENDYSIFVYHRPPGSRYDMLIGLKQLNSIKLN